jgi:membrane protein implicated in regulation of membrane protease activity
MRKGWVIGAFVLNLILLIIPSIFLGWISIIGIIIAGLYLRKIHKEMAPELKWFAVITLIISVINLSIWIWVLYKLSNTPSMGFL